MKVSRPVRTHGFTGQRMAVVPNPVWKRVGAHPLLQGLRVTDAGFFPKATGHKVVRTQGSTTHLLIACLEGAGKVSADAKTYHAGPGDIFWLNPGMPHRYESSEENPWSILWVHFTGEEALSWRRLLFQEEGEIICNVPIGQIGDLSLDRIHSILETGYSLLNLMDAATVLRHSLGMLIRLREQPGSTRSARLRVSASAEKLRSDWRHLHRIEELAMQAGVSVSHYATLFKKETGHSPIDFQIRQRIQHAARLLTTTQEPIFSVAASAGYEDPFYFSRSFRKIMGCSPRTYRNQIKV